MTDEIDFSGVWRSTQTYMTVKRPGEVLTFSIDMKFYRTGNQVVAQSVPNKDNEYVVARFSINGRVLKGPGSTKTRPPARTTPTPIMTAPRNWSYPMTATP